MRTTLIYVYDALCGWCYGFSPVMEKLHKNFSDDLDFEVVSGGMITGGRIGPIGEVAPYIRQAYRDVERATGVTFGPGFLEGTLAKGTALFTSEPPAVALCIVKAHQPHRALAFAATLQKAIYYDGIAPADLAAYGPYAAAFGFDAADFVQKMGQQAYQAQAQAEFAQAARWGVRGFPTVLLARDGKLTLLVNGFAPYERLAARLRAELATAPE